MKIREIPFEDRISFLSQKYHAQEPSLENIHTLFGQFIENNIGSFPMPLGIAENFMINGKSYSIPMVIEETSVVAAASFAAKLASLGGGFHAQTRKSLATCQIEIRKCEKINELIHFLENSLKEKVNQIFPRLVERGGGFHSFELKILSHKEKILHIHIDTKEAMGANIVNKVAESIGKYIKDEFLCDVGLCILTNLTIHRLTQVKVHIPLKELAFKGFQGEEVARAIQKASEFAHKDIFRACTHNKGVMNGIDPVVIATGNDWRAIEAGCHAWASISGKYKPLTKWEVEDNVLTGIFEGPLALGTVGGVTKLHPFAKWSLEILGKPHSLELSNIVGSVGLAQNLSALRALACEGICEGHMRLHESNLKMMSSLN